MDILKKFINNPGLEHLAENIIGFMDIDKAMEIMIESQELSDDEREIFKQILKKLMLKEAHEICKFFPFFEMFPWWMKDLDILKRSETLESFNKLYDILVLLQEVPEWCLNKEKCTLLRRPLPGGVYYAMMGFLKTVVEIKDIDEYLMEKAKSTPHNCVLC